MSGEVEAGSALLLPTPSTPHLEQLLLETFRGKLAKWPSGSRRAACLTVLHATRSPSGQAWEDLSSERGWHEAEGQKALRRSGLSVLPKLAK